jgi:hypothetical protein
MAVFMALGVASGARAGDEANRLSVAARGQASATADSIEIEFTVSAHADESIEAEKKFRDKLAKVETALKDGDAKTPAKKKLADDDDDDAAPKKKKPATPKAKPPVAPKPPKKAADDDDDDEPAPKKKPEAKPQDKAPDAEPKGDEKDEKTPDAKKDADPKAVAAIPVEVSDRNFTLAVKSAKGDDSPMAKLMARQMGGAPEKADSPMTFGCKVVATVRGVGSLDRAALGKRLAQLIDAAIEAGADGPDGDAPVVHFQIKDSEALRKAAYADAMTRAKTRAQELAALADAHVGTVLSVTELGFVTPLATGKAEDPQEKIMSQIYGLKGKDGGALPTIDVSIDIELRVDFQLK